MTMASDEDTEGPCCMYVRCFMTPLTIVVVVLLTPSKCAYMRLICTGNLGHKYTLVIMRVNSGHEAGLCQQCTHRTHGLQLPLFSE